MTAGYSINLTHPSVKHGEVAFPVPAIFVTSGGKPVSEVIFWSGNTKRWVHLVSAHFERKLDAGHVQVTAGDLAWLENVVKLHGVEGLVDCVAELENTMVPSD